MAKRGYGLTYAASMNALGKSDGVEIASLKVPIHRPDVLTEKGEGSCIALGAHDKLLQVLHGDSEYHPHRRPQRDGVLMAHIATVDATFGKKHPIKQLGEAWLLWTIGCTNSGIHMPIWTVTRLIEYGVQHVLQYAHRECPATATFAYSTIGGMVSLQFTPQNANHSHLTFKQGLADTIRRSQKRRTPVVLMPDDMLKPHIGYEPEAEGGAKRINITALPEYVSTASHAA